jgi:hypothetical protein
MLHREIMAVCSEIHTKHKHTVWAERRIIFSPHRAVNTLLLGYKKQSVNVVQGNNRCLFSDPHQTHKHAVWAERRIIYIQSVPRSKHSPCRI